MSRMLAGDLGRIAMSPGLAATLNRAAEYAASQAHIEVTLEHLMLALTEDPEAGPVLGSSQVDIARLKGDIATHLGRIEERLEPDGPAGGPVISVDLRRILEAASAAAQGRRKEIDGSIVLAAIVGEGNSTAAHMLRAHGVTFEAAIRALQRVTPGPAGPPAASNRAVARSGQGASADEILAHARERVQTRSAPVLSDLRRGVSVVPSEAGSERSESQLDARAAEWPAEAATRSESHAPTLDSETRPRVGEFQIEAPQPGHNERLEPKFSPGSAHIPAPAAPHQTPATGEHSYERSETAIGAPDLDVPPPPHPSVTPMSRNAWAPPPATHPMPNSTQRPFRAPPPIPPEAGFRPPQGRPMAAPPSVHPGSAQHFPPQYRGQPPPTAPPRPPWAEPTDPRVAARDSGRPMVPAAPPPQQRGAKRNETDQRRGTGPGLGAGQLIENIPRSMRVAVGCLVEVRIAKADVKALADGLQGGGAAWRHEVTITKAMSVRLRAPDGGFFIETASPETQWIENSLGIMADDFASWRWSVTPRTRGRQRLQLIVSARTVGADGLAAETALPDQIIDVRVRTNYGRVLQRWSGWVAAAIVGGLLAKFGEGLYVTGLLTVARLMAGS